MKNFITILFVASMIIGCTNPNDPSVVAWNKKNLSSTGEEVGILPDGRKVVRYEISRGDKLSHWVYIVNGSVTTNHLEKNGKTDVNHVEVMIEGTSYRLIPSAATDNQ